MQPSVSIRRLGYNDHGPVHMRQVVGNAIKMLNILHEAGIQTSLKKEEMGTFEDSMCAVILAGMMHDLGMAIGRQGHEEMYALLSQPIIERTLMHMFPHDLHSSCSNSCSDNRSYNRSHVIAKSIL